MQQIPHPKTLRECRSHHSCERGNCEGDNRFFRNQNTPVTQIPNYYDVAELEAKIEELKGRIQFLEVSEKTEKRFGGGYETENGGNNFSQVSFLMENKELKENNEALHR